MPICKNDKKSTYKGNEPSPKGLGYCAHSEKVGTIKKGNDGNKWIISKRSKGVRRWIKFFLNKKDTKDKKDKKDTKDKKDKKDKIIDCSKFVRYIGKNIVKGKYKIKNKLIYGLEVEKGKLYKWISYNKFAKKQIIIPKNFRKKRMNDSDKKYYCGNKSIISKESNEYKSIKQKHKGWTYYITHDNGNKPYCVYISSKNEVYIYKEDNKNIISDEMYGELYTYTKLIKKYKCKKVFIGESIDTNIGEYYYYDKYFNGNSILLKINSTEYIYIGNSIYSFKTKNEIIDYKSPMGNNDVPYPFAIDSKNNYYLMIGQVIVHNNGNKINDPYNYYYISKKDRDTISKSLKIKIISKRDW